MRENCFAHGYAGGVECPVCKKIAALTRENEKLRACMATLNDRIHTLMAELTEERDEAIAHLRRCTVFYCEYDDECRPDMPEEKVCDTCKAKWWLEAQGEEGE
jgi:hypothetical protein